MPGKNTDVTAAHQVELAIRQLDSLSTLPCVAACFSSKLSQTQFLTSELDDIIESAPALAAKIISIIHQQGLSLENENYSLRRALDKIPAYTIRDAILSVKVFDDADRNIDSPILRKQLVLHCLAVGCCAKGIAEIISPQVNSQLAYLAGLLHDIGTLALNQVMPKSFARIVQETKYQNASACSIEQKQLGLDHTILGKRLAQKWHLPDQITLAIWLHHSDTVAVSQNMPEARIAQIVQLADSVSRQCGIGQSASYDSPDLAEAIAQSLSINLEQLEQIRQNLSEEVRQKSEVLGLDLPKSQAFYCDAVHSTAAQLARDNTKLSQENRQLQMASSHFDFAADFLLSINSATEAIEIAEDFAVRWQKFYQTGMVCLYLNPATNPQSLEAVVVENLSQSRTVSLKAPVETPAIPKAIANSFAILNARDYVDWLFEQLDVDFDLGQTKLVPLLANSKAIGAIVFELRYPADTELFEEKFETVTSLAGTILDMAFACESQQYYAERFAQLVAKPKSMRRKPDIDNSLSALAEMAAGAAHELNNPLLVISGRAQLLAETETDPERKQILKQIKENANEISQIVEDLMSFARPQQPRPTQTNINQMLDEAVQLTSQKTNVEHINVQIEVAEASEKVFVDSAQIASAIANVISNSLESYTDQLGPIKVTAEPDESGDFVKLQIADLGCGMDAETVRKATQPFFCSKPAGRKRGMGLAHAGRLIQLNGGSLEITSQPGEGTTVTILLPCK